MRRTLHHRLIAAAAPHTVFIACTISLFIGCSDGAGPVQGRPPSPSGTPVFTSLRITPAADTFAVGKISKRRIVALDQYGQQVAGLSVNYENSDFGIADTLYAVLFGRSVSDYRDVVGAVPGTTEFQVTAYDGNISRSASQSLIVVASDSAAVYADASDTASFEFQPYLVEITRVRDSASVSWNLDSVAHTIHWDSEPVGADVGDSPATSDSTVKRRFTLAGHYSYHCLIHPGMYGAVDVK